MKITKLGHSCLLIEEQQARILIDPGNLSTSQNNLTDLDAILITHEHDDHCYLPSVQAVLKNNPQAKIYSNTGVEEKLSTVGIPLEVIKDGDTFMIKNVTVEVVGELHVEIHSSIPRIPNTGYFIAQRFFYPGDSLDLPSKPVEILALPLAGPWLRLSEGINYGQAVKPKVCFPVHDGILKSPLAAHKISNQVLTNQGIKFIIPEENQAMEF